MPRRILMCGDEAILLSTRGMVLSKAGFSVVSACNNEDLESISQNPPVDLGIIGHSVPEHRQQEIARYLRTRWPDTRVLCLTRRPQSLQEQSPGCFTVSSEKPAELIAACEHLLERST